MQELFDKKAILLMNLGSPDSTSVKDVRRYLNEFLMDERVIDINPIVRTLLVKGLIVPLRAPKSAAAYKSIWTEEGSPLVHLTYEVQAALQKLLQEPVEVCMRYGNPSPKQALLRLKNNFPDLNEVILLPLYPHYAMSSYETAVEYVKKIHAEIHCSFTLSVVPPFYNHTAYIDALSKSILPYLQKSYDLILFSYHGIPERHVKKSDTTKTHCLQNNDCCSIDSAAHAFCYRHQIIKTTELAAAELGIPKNKYAYSFQSRLGRDAWLKPYTAQRLRELPAEGIKHLVIVCPAFVSDCLETLEEMGEEGKEIFLNAGGESFTLVPCMNTQPSWITAIKDLLKSHTTASLSAISTTTTDVSIR
jgi:protoporphyrin/coproporphyrin ferrochelatase